MSNLKTLVSGAYDIQSLRIMMGNRIVANFKSKLGQAPQKKEDTMDAQGKMILSQLRSAYKKLTDGVKTFPRQKSFAGDEVISSFTELCLMEQYTALEAQEVQHFKRLETVLRDYPIYTGFLKDVKGIGPAMAGVIVSQIDITRAEYPSSLWKYAGLDVTASGRGRSMRKEDMGEVEYVDAAGEIKTRKTLGYNPFLKKKLMGVLAASFLRAGENAYSKVYYEYKNRLKNHPAHAEKTDGHRHNMALRYMVKRFLVDLYREWRTLEGLPVAAEYSEAKLGIKHKVA